MTLDSISALRAYTTAAANELVSILGYHTPGDGGGGNFFWDTATLSLPDGGTILDVTGTPAIPGRWKRLFSGPVNVKWFGAKMDGVTDDSDELQQAINSGNVVYVPEGTLAIAKPVLLTHGRKVVGASQEKTTIIKTTHNTLSTGTAAGIDSIFIIDIDAQTYVRNVTLKNMLLRGYVSGDKVAYGVYTSRGHSHLYENIYVDNVITGFYWKVIFQTRVLACIAQKVATGFKIDAPENELGGTSTVFERCWALVVSEKGYDFKSLVYSTMLSCASERILWEEDSVLANPAYGYYFDSCTGFSMQGCGVEKLNGCAVHVANSTGFSITGMNAAIDNHGSFATLYAFGHITLINSFVTITSSNFYLTEPHRYTVDHYISGSQVTMLSSNIIGWGKKDRTTPQIENDSTVIDLTGKEQNKPDGFGYAKGLARLTGGIITERRIVNIANLAADSGIVYLPENAILKRVKVLVTNSSAGLMKLFINFHGSVNGFYYTQQKAFVADDVVSYEPPASKQIKPTSVWGIRLNAGDNFTGFACVMEVDYYISQF